ncbi:MAG: peptidase S8 [Chloroflexi bacterium]|nr:peptidase S8 [Chloroflexota bacterium]
MTLNQRTLHIGLVVLFLLLALSFAAPVEAGSSSGGPNAPDEVLVSLVNGADAAAIARSVGAQATHQTRLGVWIFMVPAGTADLVAATLRTNPQVIYAEPNGVVSVFADPNDPHDNTTCYSSSKAGCIMQWSWAKIQAYQGWDIHKGSATVKIAVVDTGIDNSHPDLPTMTSQKNFIVPSNPAAEDDNGHGTHLAGTIGALTNNGEGVAGMDWSVSLRSVKVLHNTGYGSISTLADGITWAADNGAKVINISLGSTTASTTLANAVTYAWNHGAVLVCAAGNNGNTKFTYPAYYANCIAVAATDSKDAKASTSTTGTWVDVAAPGVNILSTMPNTTVYLNTTGAYKTTYDAMSGTSMAAAHVSGLAGLIWASGKCSTNTCVRYLIENNADAISGTGKSWAKGRINAYRSLSATSTQPTPTRTPTPTKTPAPTRTPRPR